MKNILLGFTFLFSSLLLANPVETGHAKASLITNLQNSDQESFYVGVRLQMQDGWHTYWENPGDSGSPFEVKWSTDPGVIVENVQWPTPVTIPYPPLMTYGYEGDIVFPFQIFRSQETNLKTISVDFDFLICADICIPETASLSLDFTSASPDKFLDTQIEDLPTKFIATKSSVEEDNLVVSFQTNQSFSNAYLFPRQDNYFTYSETQKLEEVSDGSYKIIIPLIDGDPESFS